MAPPGNFSDSNRIFWGLQKNDNITVTWQPPYVGCYDFGKDSWRNWTIIESE
jgi:hypothetical protein